MIAIVDSGSTKSDWRILDEKGNRKIILNRNGEEEFIKTVGLNPYFLKAERIVEEIKKNEYLMDHYKEISHIFFYGAGCSAPKYVEIVKKALDEVFINSKNVVEHDLLAASYACYDGKPVIVCILGTGSNSCYFDGKNPPREETPSLAYVLGDEGSGNHIGKKVLRSFFLKKMPTNIALELQRYMKEELKEPLTIGHVNERVYSNPFANTYLASLNKFVALHKDKPFFQKIIYDSLKDFIVNQILIYPEARFVDLNFIGSIADLYRDTLEMVASEFQLKIGEIIRKPIERLVTYHIKYTLPNLKA